ncbi:hypothetical protein T05_8693, partial [Trichinella murrelli]
LPTKMDANKPEAISVGTLRNDRRWNRQFSDAVSVNCVTLWYTSENSNSTLWGEGILRKTDGEREHPSTSERREYRIEEPYNPRLLQKARQLNYYMIEELLQKPPLRKTAAECATYAALAVRSMTSENSAMLPESAMGKL